MTAPVFPTPPIFQYFNHFHQWFQQHQLEAYGGLAGLFVAGVAVKALKRHRWRQRNLTTHGSARWATEREVQHSGFSRRHGVVMGVHGGDVWLDDLETHDLLLAPTGSGKDTFHINPTLAWGWTQSTLTLDPKDGQTYDVTGSLRTQYGDIAAFAPYRSPLACIDVLDSIRMGKPEEFGDALLIGQSLTAPERMRRESSAGVHFRELAALTIAAASLHVRYAISQASLGAVWHFLTQQGSFADALKIMSSTPHTRHGVHQAVAEMSRVMANIGSGEELGSAWSTTLRPLLLYLDPYVARSTDTSTLNLENLQYGARPLSLYLLAPSPRALSRLHPIYRVILDVAFARLMEHKTTEQRHRLLIVGNELPSWGYMHAVNKGAADMRDYGIKGLFIAQDLQQLEDTYGEDPDIWTNTECKMFHTPANDRAAKRISDNFLGKQTVEYLVTSRQGGRPSVVPHRVGRELLTTDEVMRLARHQLIVILRGLRPMLFEKYGYDRHYQAA
jgi:type IV secretion system protein VirD4